MRAEEVRESRVFVRRRDDDDARLTRENCCAGRDGRGIMNYINNGENICGKYITFVYIFSVYRSQYTFNASLRRHTNPALSGLINIDIVERNPPTTALGYTAKSKKKKKKE